MEALDADVRRLGLWLLLERPGESSWRLTVKWPKQAVRDGRPYVRRYAMLRNMSGRTLASAATSLRLDLERDPPA
jgi:hypothetical protein